MPKEQKVSKKTKSVTKVIKKTALKKTAVTIKKIASNKLSNLSPSFEERLEPKDKKIIFDQLLFLLLFP